MIIIMIMIIYPPPRQAMPAIEQLPNHRRRSFGHNPPRYNYYYHTINSNLDIV